MDFSRPSVERPKAKRKHNNKPTLRWMWHGSRHNACFLLLLLFTLFPFIDHCRGSTRGPGKSIDWRFTGVEAARNHSGSRKKKTDVIDSLCTWMFYEWAKTPPGKRSHLHPLEFIVCVLLLVGVVNSRSHRMHHREGGGELKSRLHKRIFSFVAKLPLEGFSLELKKVPLSKNFLSWMVIMIAWLEWACSGLQNVYRSQLNVLYISRGFHRRLSPVMGRCESWRLFVSILNVSHMPQPESRRKNVQSENN